MRIRHAVNRWSRGGALYGWALLFAATLTIAAQAAQPDEPLVVTLSVDEIDAVEHPQGWPLLLQVSVNNPRAANTRTSNATAEQAMRRLRETGRLERMTRTERTQAEQMFAAVDIPAITLGSNAVPVWSLITLEAKDQGGGILPVKMRPLADTMDQKVSATLDGRGGVRMLFGIDADVLKSVPPGRYELRSLLTAAERQGTWQGRISSDPITVRLVAMPSSDAAVSLTSRDYAAGSYHILDRQFERAKVFADQILERSPDSVEGLTIAGDAHVGLDRLQEAERAYVAAIAAFHNLAAARTRATPDSNEPAYLVEQLREVRRRLKEKP